MNSSTFRLPTSHLFIKLHHLLSLINLKSFKGNNISNIFYLVSSTMGITFSHQTTSNDFARKKTHRLNLDLVVKEREIRLKEVARIAAVEAASSRKLNGRNHLRNCQNVRQWFRH